MGRTGRSVIQEMSSRGSKVGRTGRSVIQEMSSLGSKVGRTGRVSNTRDEFTWQ